MQECEYMNTGNIELIFDQVEKMSDAAIGRLADQLEAIERNSAASASSPAAFCASDKASAAK